MREITKNINLEDKRLFLLDIDGTIAFDHTLIDGAMEFFNEVHTIGGKYIFITNNSTKSRNDYVRKFTDMGVLVDEESFLTSSYATALYLREKYRDGLIFVLGTNSFISELRDFGLYITQEKEKGIVSVVVGFDNELNYEKVETICDILFTMDVDYIATNPDLACPTGFGFVPDCGAICGMLYHAVKREPVFIGKPNPLIVKMAMESTGFWSDQTIVIGDRLYTDIACGIRAGVDTALVFTGEAKRKDLDNTEFTPSYYADNIAQIYQCIKR